MSLGDGPYVNGKGRSPVGLSEGSRVVGFYLDFKSRRTPMIFGTWATMPDKDPDKSQVPHLSRGVDVLNETVGPEPKSSFAAKYPYNDSRITKSGHSIEFDDTPESERIRIRHNSGSYVEMNSSGDFIIKAKNNSFDISTKNKTIYIGGDGSMEIKGSLDINVEGPVNIKSKSLDWEVE